LIKSLIKLQGGVGKYILLRLIKSIQSENLGFSFIISLGKKKNLQRNTEGFQIN